MMSDENFDPADWADEDEEPLEFIPAELHSWTEEGPFTRCVDCDMELYESGEQYMVQKSIHRGEVVFEFALCTGCHETLSQGFSKETTKRLMAHFQKLEANEPTMHHCLDCRQPLAKMSSYNIAGQCIGPFLDSAFVICDSCQEHIHPLISEETRKSRDKWIGQNFPCAPESRDLVPDSPMMF